MKNRVIWLAALLCLLCFVPAWAGAEETPEPSEWTVMFYFCGSDLESGHGYASGNIREIAECMTYEAVGAYLTGQQAGEAGPDAVNVVLETGGSREWHAQELGMNVRTDALQRWHCRPGTQLLEENSAAIELKQELPLASMARPETLADFIRWSAENYPAKKYALVLWDHGTGAMNGLIIDELFDGETMGLDQLKTALADGGVHFEAVLFDACLMASLETACAIKDSANWMIASEELVAGKGTAMNMWLRQLFVVPQFDGMRLGRWICEMNMYKYADQESDHEQNVITWSVIDLSKIDRVAEAFDRFFAYCGQVYADGADDYSFSALCKALNDSFEFGLGDAEMIDLADLPYHPYIVLSLDRELYAQLLDALTDAVAYNTHGPERARAGGLSFCYPYDATPSQLDKYARVCPSAHYLALLDAIHPNWNAPDWVYSQAEALPKIVDIPAYQIRVQKSLNDEGMPQFTVVDGYRNFRYAYVDLLRKNPRTDNTVYLGELPAEISIDETAQQAVFSFSGLDEWPTLEDVHCTAQIVNMDYLYGRVLYQIPLRMGNDTYMLRCGIEDFNKPAVVYGLWEGYSADSGAFSRNVIPLTKVAGQEYVLLYPIDGSANGRTRYETSGTLTMYRSLDLSTKPLDPGTYYLEYSVEDIFQRLLPVERVEIQWDGQKVTVAEGAWEGETTLTLK